MALELTVLLLVACFRGFLKCALKQSCFLRYFWFRAMWPLSLFTQLFCLQATGICSLYFFFFVEYSQTILNLHLHFSLQETNTTSQDFWNSLLIDLWFFFFFLPVCLLLFLNGLFIYSVRRRKMLFKVVFAAYFSHLSSVSLLYPFTVLCLCLSSVLIYFYFCAITLILSFLEYVEL